MSTFDVLSALAIASVVMLSAAAVIDYVQAKKKTLREQGLKTVNRNINV